MGGAGDTEESDQEQEDQERKRIHEGHEDVKPEPGVTAGLDQFTEEERRQEAAGGMPGAGPDEEPGSDRDRGGQKDREPGGDGERNGERKRKEKQDEERDK